MRPTPKLYALLSRLSDGIYSNVGCVSFIFCYDGPRRRNGFRDQLEDRLLAIGDKPGDKDIEGLLKFIKGKMRRFSGWQGEYKNGSDTKNYSHLAYLHAALSNQSGMSHDEFLSDLGWVDTISHIQLDRHALMTAKPSVASKGDYASGARSGDDGVFVFSDDDDEGSAREAKSPGAVGRPLK